MTKLRLLIVTSLLLVAVGTTAAQPAFDAPRILENRAGLELTPLSNAQRTREMGVLIGNGTVDTPANWPGTFVGRADNQQCTATLIGPSVLLTAAHCVAPGGEVTIDHADGTPLARGGCDRAPGWTMSTPSVDLALCLMDKPVSAQFVAYESISLDHSRLQINERLRLAGYGCTNYKNPIPAPIPEITIGTAAIEFLPGSYKEWPSWAITYDFSRDGSAYFCDGDSGGGVYYFRDSRRQIVGVASAFEDRPGHPAFGRSYFTALSTGEARQFITGWVNRRKAPVCGIGSFQHPRCRPL